MSFADGVVNSAFKKDAHGRTVFYPWGRHSRGYVVSREQELAARKVLRRMHWWTFGIIFSILILGDVAGSWVGLLIGLSIAGAIVMYSVIVFRRITARAERSDLRLGYLESVRTRAAATGWVAMTSIVASVCLFDAMIVASILFRSLSGWLVALCLVVLLVITIPNAIFISIWLQARRSAHAGQVHSTLN